VKDVPPERVQKLIAASGLCSRREAERHIEEGRVRVNGKVARLGDKAPPGTPIFVANKPIPSVPERPVTLVLNKPKGCVCTNSDPHGGRTVFQLLPPDLGRLRLFCAGRLDKDSEGLVVLTNDGDLAARLTHPGSGVVKRYRLTLHRDFDRGDIPRLLGGLEDEGEFLRADKVLPAPDTGPRSARRLEVHMRHGRKRELRRLFRAHGYFVKKLVRVRIGGIILRNLPQGGYRLLGQKEIERLFA
jgi:23S rRNA pseudouridine2605 synthase